MGFGSGRLAALAGRDYDRTPQQGAATLDGSLHQRMNEEQIRPTSVHSDRNQASGAPELPVRLRTLSSSGLRL
jgi:hypothetical protein